MKDNFASQLDKLSLDQKRMLRALCKKVESKDASTITKEEVQTQMTDDTPALSGSLDSKTVEDLLDSLKCIH